MNHDTLHIIVIIFVYEFISRPLSLWALSKFRTWRKRSNPTIRVSDAVGVLVMLLLGIALAFATVY